MRLALLGTTIGTVFLLAGCSGYDDTPTGPLVRDHQVIERGPATTADVSLEMGAGDFEITTGATALMEADFAYNVPTLKPSIDYQLNGTKGELKVTQTGSATGNHENNWKVSLQETTPTALHISLGAGDARFAIGKLNLTKLDVSLGAGDLEVDLRGTPKQSYSADIQAGAGDTTVRVPLTAALSVRTMGAIGDVNVAGLEERDGRWVNPKAPANAPTIDVSVKHAIGDLKIIAE
jgi:hypothetical protein